MRYPNFDLLRLLLALEVVVVHAWNETDPNFNWPGFIMAVPAFLAISGFLVLKSYEESGSWRSFAKKRALRILPALMVSMVLCWALFDAFAAFNSLLNWLTGGLYTLRGTANGPLWSLAWEEVAYALLAVLFSAGAYRKPVLIWALFAASLYIVHVGRTLTPWYQMILLLLPSFFIGNLTYLHRNLLTRVHPLIPWVFLLAVINGHQIPYFASLMRLSEVSFQAFAVVWTGMAGFRLIPWRFPDISYGLYIFHMPIILYMVKHGLVTTTADIAWALPLPLLMVSSASWYLVEKPALRFKPGAPRADDQRITRPSRE